LEGREGIPVSTKVRAEEKSHAKFSPSASGRWIACPGSVKASEGIPSEDSAASVEGTQGHECLETLLTAGPHKQLATEAFLRKTYPAEMVTHAAAAAQAIWKMLPKGATLLAETKARCTHIHPEFHGTADAVIIEDFGTLYVFDYKYGRHPVEVKENTQLISYALGIAHEHEYNFTDVVLVIIQPRAMHDEGPVRSWRLCITELAEWADIFRKAVKAAEAKNAKRVSGSHCRFCPAAVTCEEFKGKALSEARASFDVTPLGVGRLRHPTPDAKGIATPEQLGKTLWACDQLEAWIGRVREHAFNELKRGRKIPGWKLVEKRGTRQWLNAELAGTLARKKFGKAAFTVPELLSPAQLEKLGAKGKEFVGRYAATISSGLKLVPADHPGEAHDQLAIDFGPKPQGKKKRPVTD
jgi:hypothetical protein